MPVYAYACVQCGHAFDARQSFDEPALTTCEQCGGALRKQYGSVGVTFHGSGFYRTDSRQSASSKADSPAAKPAGSKASESKPASTASPASSGGSSAVS